MGFGRDVRAAIFSQVQSYSLAEFETFGASTLITRNTNDAQQVERFLQMLITMAVMTPVMFIGAVVMAFLTNAEMALLIFVVIPVIIIIVALFLKIGMAAPAFAPEPHRCGEPRYARRAAGRPGDSRIQQGRF